MSDRRPHRQSRPWPKSVPPAATTRPKHASSAPAPPASARPRRRRLKAAAALGLCLVAVAGAAGQFGLLRRAVHLARPLTSPAATTQSGSMSPSKEYIYAGGRLVATEEAAASQSPFGGAARQLPGTIQAEDFDDGGQGVAYHDTDPSDNVMNAYRPDPSGVDIEACGDAGGGFNVGWTWAGEWTEYTVVVTAPGVYTLEARVASGNGGGGTFHVEVDGADVTGPLAVPNTGGWQTYQTVPKAGVQLSAGQHVLRLALDTAGPQGGVANFNYLRFTSGAGGPAPSNLLATAGPTAQVSVTWGTPAGAVSHYEVERTQTAAGGWATIAPNVSGTSYTDSTASAGAAYLYRVRAVFSGGGAGEYSNADLAVAAAFTDDPLAAGVTRIKAAHVTELRQAVNAARAVAGLPAAGWTDASLAGVLVKAAHVEELRARLDEALSALGLPTLAYTDPSLSGVAVKKAHVEELRQRVK